MKIAVCFLVAIFLHTSKTEAAAAFNHYPLVYNFYDVLAQATCTAKATTQDRIWAVRRSCPGSFTCTQICSRLALKCFQAYHVYKNPPILEENSGAQTDEGVVGLSMYSYLEGNKGCNRAASNCGTNYCCCRGPYNALT